MPSFPIEYPGFFTATNLEWRKLLKNDSYKEIIIRSLRFLVNEHRINLFSFVIMDNHIHLIWQMLRGHLRKEVQRDFLKFTANQIKRELERNSPEILECFLVNAKDRKYQFWERNSLNIELRNSYVFNQKLDYIHWNPVKAGLCSIPEEYNYSSAKFYQTGIDNWGFLTHGKV